MPTMYICNMSPRKRRRSPVKEKTVIYSNSAWHILEKFRHRPNVVCPAMTWTLGIRGRGLETHIRIGGEQHWEGILINESIKYCLNAFWKHIISFGTQVDIQYKTSYVIFVFANIIGHIDSDVLSLNAIFTPVTQPAPPQTKKNGIALADWRPFDIVAVHSNSPRTNSDVIFLFGNSMQMTCLWLAATDCLLRVSLSGHTSVSWHLDLQQLNSEFVIYFCIKYTQRQK